MACRFGGINFNFMRATEIFQDLNHADMDVNAPASDENFTKEAELAQRLQEHLDFLIDDGFFEDCDERARSDLGSEEYSDSEAVEEENEDEDGHENDYDDEDEDDYNSRPSASVKSEGFSLSRSESASGLGEHSASERMPSAESRETLTGRFKRYVRRILPRIGRQSSSSMSRTRRESSQHRRESSGSSGHNLHSLSDSSSHHDRDHHHHHHHGHVKELSGSFPYDSRVVYKHDHYHKHDHAGAHHHHAHHGPHTHSYHRHADEPEEVPLSDEGPASREELLDEEDEQAASLSDAFRRPSSSSRQSGSTRSDRSRRSGSSSRRSRNSLGRR